MDLIVEDAEQDSDATLTDYESDDTEDGASQSTTMTRTVNSSSRGWIVPTSSLEEKLEIVEPNTFRGTSSGRTLNLSVHASGALALNGRILNHAREVTLK